MSPAVRLLAKKYRARRVGRSATAIRDLILPFNELLKEADCLYGPARTEAEQEFRDLESHDCVTLERASRDASAILKVRLSPASEAAFFEHIGETGPNTERRQLALLFEKAADFEVPSAFADSWHAFCRECAQAAVSGASLAPCFDRTNMAQTTQILDALPRLLAWPGESFRRFTSAAIFGNSKVLETLQPRIEACLSRISGDQICSMGDLGIRENPRSIILHGPITLTLPGGSLNLGLLHAPARINAADLRAASLTTRAARCITVENAAMLHELAKFQSGVILASSGSEGGFAHTAIIDFLRALPPGIGLFHFGDSDPAGFDILRDLRERSDLNITSLHMRHRSAPARIPLGDDDPKIIKRLLNSAFLTKEEKDTLRTIEQSGDKGLFEQESLGVPAAIWPFYTS